MRNLFSFIQQRRFITTVTVLWILLIFSFSLQPADVSSALSDGIGELIIENASTEASEKFANMTVVEMKLFHAVLRKSGHFAEFFVLGVLMYLSIRKSKVVHKTMMATLCCVMVAAMDESIQLFVDGRAGLLSDVLLDTCGSIMGLLVIKGFVLLRN